MENRQQGTVIFYLRDKGYGYIRLMGTREEFHFREKNLATDLINATDQVTFIVKEGRQGYFADAIKRMGVA